MNTPHSNRLTILRTVAKNAVLLGHYDDARRIYQSILKALEESHGRGSQQYNECLKEAGQTVLHRAGDPG